MVGSRFCELSVDTFDLLKVDLNAKIHVDITSRNSIDKFFKNFDFFRKFHVYTLTEKIRKQQN